MNLEDLKKEMPFRWRVQSFSDKKAIAFCVPYINSRDAQDRLDEVCGADRWQNDFKGSANQIGGVGIKMEDEWVWKWDVGTESNIEKEKGKASDAFKRACVQWGLGRFLYSMGTFKVPSNAPKHKEKNPRPYVVDLEGQYVWDLTEFVNKIWTKANVGVEEVTDLAKRMEAKYISANDFTDKLAQYRIAFESAGREGEFQKHLMDNFNTDNEAHIVREFFKSAKPIIDEINKLYKGLK